MKKKVEVIEQKSDLERIVWVIEFLGYGYSVCRFVLTEWRHERRETKRHKYRCSQSDQTLWSSCGSNSRYNKMPRPAVPDHIAEQARKEFADSIKIEQEGGDA